MPIKTTISVGAESDKFKKSFALFQKYQAALKEQYGAYVNHAPYVKAVAEAGSQVTKFLNLDQAARSQTQFAAAAQKASLTFKGLASGVKQTLEGFARVALSPLEILFPAGLAVGLLGVGAGLIGAGSLYGLERGAAGVSDRRRQAMGLGVSYGALSAYDLNFSRFGVGQETLGAVAGGVYDFTSPEYLGLVNAGALGHGDTSDDAIALIRNIPELFKNTPDAMTGLRARSLGLPLDIQSIIRLKNHPEEIESQVKRYQQDRKTLDISKDAQKKWSSFNAAIEEAGQTIQSSLGRLLAGSGAGSGPHPRGGSQEGIINPLTTLSGSIVNIIDAVVDSGTATDAMKGIQSGLSQFTAYIGGSTFKEDAKGFIEAIKALEPYAEAIAKVAGIATRLGVAGYKLFADPNYNPSLGGLVSDALGVKGQDAPHRTSTGLGGSSIRNYAGRGKERPPYGRVIDSTTGKMLPAPKSITTVMPQSMSDIPDLSGESTYGRKGEPLQDVSGFIWHHTGSRGTPEGVINTLNQRGLGIQYIMDRDGKIYHALPEGTRGAHILPSEINNLSNSNTEGMEVIANDDSDVTMAEVIAAKRFAQEFSKFHPGVQYFGHGEVNPHHKQATEGLTIADAVRNGLIPTTTPSAPANIPLTQRTLMNFAGGSADAAPVSSGVDAALAESVDDRFSEMQRNRNRSLKARGGHHILDHMDKGPPPGPIVVHDMTGGSAQITISRHEATQ